MMCSLLAFMITLLFGNHTSAARYSSTNYLIDGSLDANFGGQTASSNYRMTSTGGETLVGSGSSGSYKIAMAYDAQLAASIQVDVSQGSVTFASLIAGTPQTAQVDVLTLTDASGYNLALSQSGNLNNGAGSTILPVSGTIASPSAWTNGTTKGFGFSVTAAPGGVPVQWNTGSSYAQFPGTSTTFLTRSGATTATETTTLRYKVDVTSSQATGNYVNTITTTGTITP